MHCLEVLVKCFLFLVNLVVVVASLALVAAGTYLKINFKEILENVLKHYEVENADFVLPPFIDVVPIAIIVLGVIVFVISFSGCCGAISEVRCLLALYAVLMAILAGFMIYVVVASKKYLLTFTSLIDDWLKKQFEIQLQTFPSIFLAVEMLFKCCGMYGPESYSTFKPINTPMGPIHVIPGSCCSNPVPVSESALAANLTIPINSTVPICEETPATLMYDGCSETVNHLVKTYLASASNYFILLICAEVLAMVLALYLICRISSKIRAKNNYAKQY